MSTIEWLEEYFRKCEAHEDTHYPPDGDNLAWNAIPALLAVAKAAKAYRDEMDARGSAFPDGVIDALRALEEVKP